MQDDDACGDFGSDPTVASRGTCDRQWWSQGAEHTGEVYATLAGDCQAIGRTQGLRYWAVTGTLSASDFEAADEVIR